MKRWVLVGAILGIAAVAVTLWLYERALRGHRYKLPQFEPEPTNSWHW